MVKPFVMAVLAAAMLLPGCSRYSEEEDLALNVQYMKEVLGPIVLNYRAKFGRLPDTFSEAMDGTDARLSHRGDYFGRGMTYTKTGSNSFAFHFSCGPNRQGNDFKVEWKSGVWVVERE